MSIVKVPLCLDCGVPHVPEEVAERVHNGEEITIEIIAGSGLARNVLEHGTGGLNIDGCRISGSKPDTTRGAGGQNGKYSPIGAQGRIKDDGQGRFPANLLLSHVPGPNGCVRIGEKRVKGDSPKKRNRSAPKFSGRAYNNGEAGVDANAHSAPNGYADPDGRETVAAYECAEGCPCRLMDEMSGVSKGQAKTSTRKAGFRAGKYSGTIGHGDLSDITPTGYGDSGGSSRFFQQFHEPDTGAGFVYQSKASKKDRSSNGAVENTHPTAKPTALLQYLARLICPPGGTVLDPFLGSGSTAVACLRENFNCIGIEQDPEYASIARSRIEAERNM